jgi:hypothetical protein
MKTSNKTNNRSAGFIFLIMVMILVSGNAVAQTSYKVFTFASLKSTYIPELDLSLPRSVVVENTLTEEPIEDWMLDPEVWGNETAESNYSDVNFSETEIDLENWMLDPSSWLNTENEVSAENIEFKETEMILEDWMMKANWDEESKVEGEMQIEDWMISSAGW